MAASAGRILPWIAALIVRCSHELLGLLNGQERLQLEQLKPLKS
jgi:hypothetical protein